MNRGISSVPFGSASKTFWNRWGTSHLLLSLMEEKCSEEKKAADTMKDCQCVTMLMFLIRKCTLCDSIFSTHKKKSMFYPSVFCGWSQQNCPVCSSWWTPSVLLWFVTFFYPKVIEHNADLPNPKYGKKRNQCLFSNLGKFWKILNETREASADNSKWFITFFSS